MVRTQSGHLGWDATLNGKVGLPLIAKAKERKYCLEI